MKTYLRVFCALLLAVTRAYSWGGNGHRAITEAAAGMLTPKAKASVVKILGNEDLASIATWLDDVRLAKKHHSGPLKEDAEAKEFKRFPLNEVWHYVDLPVGSMVYSEAAPSVSPNDIVHAIHHAVNVLEGRMSDMTDLQALKVLVHLVGDAHQPLHSVAGYFDCSDPAHPKLISDPVIARTKSNDRGGNQLFFGKSLQLHRFWEDTIVKDLAARTPERPLAQGLAAFGANENWKTSGDYHPWAERWIEDSASQATEVYRGLVFGSATVKADGSIDRIEIILPDQFWERQMRLAKVQMAKAVIHLADLLNNIQFKH
jgi:hypothetical protein